MKYYKCLILAQFEKNDPIPSRHFPALSEANGVVLVSLLLTLNIFHTFVLVFLLLILDMQWLAGLHVFLWNGWSRKSLSSFISSQHHCQRFLPFFTSNSLQARFEPNQNLTFDSIPSNIFLIKINKRNTNKKFVNNKVNGIVLVSLLLTLEIFCTFF